MIRTVSPMHLCGLALLLAGCAGGSSGSGSPGPVAGATRPVILADDLQLRIEILAHDSLLGREAGTPGIEAAARYLASELRRLGLEPAGDDSSFFQAVPLERRLTDASLRLYGAAGSRALGDREVVPVSGLAGLPEASRLEGSGSLVYAGHLMDPTVGSDELMPSQLRNAAVLVRLSPPAGIDPSGTPARMAIASLFGPNSPATAVLLVAEEGEEEFWGYASEIARKGVVSLPGSGGPGGQLGAPFFLVSPAVAEEILGASLEQARKPATDLGTFEFRLEQRVERFEGMNVAAVFPGADPDRARQYVALGAHYDHVGVGAPMNGDSIYNGADDNASGTAALLEIAEALAHLPARERPARSVLFVWKTAEESGLLGSEHFTDYPPVRREAIVAHINLDMVGRNHPDSIYSVGSRRISSELGDIVEAVNRRQPRPFLIDYGYDAPGHPEQIYCRSDHYNYARYGIPILFLTTGLHNQYHAPSDESHLIDNEKLARVTSLVHDIVVELANRAERPRVDQPVPPLGTPCS